MSDGGREALAERVREAARRAAERHAAEAHDGMRPIRVAPPAMRPGEAALEEVSRVNTELTNLQRELASRNAELDRLNERKNQLLGMVAHDLRNPLGTIRGFAELLAWELEDVLDDSGHGMLREIVDSSERLSRMIDDLLDASALEAGELALHLEADVDIASIVAATTRLHRTTAERKAIQLSHAVDADAELLVSGDPVKLGQVISNLLSNAIKYSHRDTTVTVSLGLEGDDVVLRVQDQGQGMKDDDLARLFTAYGTTSVAPTAGERSIGLGLTIVKTIVEGHGGTIEVASTSGVGSTFTVRLPCMPASVISSTVPARPSVPHGVA